GFEDDIRVLFASAIGEGLNARVQNLGAARLYVDRRKSAQVSVERRDQRIPAFGGVAEPVRPHLKHTLFDPVNTKPVNIKPVKILFSGEASVRELSFKIGCRGERDGQCRQGKL